MGISFKMVLNRLGLDNPLIGLIPILMDKIGRLIVVHGLDPILGVLHVGALHPKLLNKHLPSQPNQQQQQQIRGEEEEEAAKYERGRKKGCRFPSLSSGRPPSATQSSSFIAVEDGRG